AGSRRALRRARAADRPDLDAGGRASRARQAGRRVRPGRIWNRQELAREVSAVLCRREAWSAPDLREPQPFTDTDRSCGPAGRGDDALRIGPSVTWRTATYLACKVRWQAGAVWLLHQSGGLEARRTHDRLRAWSAGLPSELVREGKTSHQ